MSWASVATFYKPTVTQDPDTLQEVTAYEPRTVLCEVRSVYASDFFAAAHAGLRPAAVLILSNFADYEGERVVKVGDDTFTVIRRYRDGDRLELTLEERTGEPEVRT